MMTICLNIYEYIQILLVNFIKLLNYFKQNEKTAQFILLRNSKNFLYAVVQTSDKFEQIKISEPNAQIFWSHVSSAGELEQLVPLAEFLNKKLNAYFFVTYYSASAEPFLKSTPWCVGTSSLPLDITSVYQKAYQILRFEKIFFVRYDLWPALVCFAHKQKIELNLLFATKEKTSKGFKAFLSKKWNFFLYKKFTHIFVITKDDLEFFHQALPNQKIILAGDTKWHRAKQRAVAFQNILLSCDNQKDIETKLQKMPLNSKENEFIYFFRSIQQHIKNNHLKCVVFGSPHAEEHQIALNCSKNLNSFLMIYVPHKVSKTICLELYEQIEKNGGKPCLYSEIAKHSSHNLSLYNVIIIDTIGHLAELYALANVAIVGGGFDGQIHNTLEAVAHEIPILIGSKVSRAPEAQTLVTAGAALSFEKPNLLFQFLVQWVNLDKNMKELKNAQQKAIELFKCVPNTNQLILDIFLQETNHDNKTIDH